MSSKRSSSNLRARRRLADTRARRLRVALATWECTACGAHLPDIYKTRGDVRYFTCAKCGAKGKLYIS